jgi:diguanylate cyclase (GGDEF)-like protein
VNHDWSDTVTAAPGWLEQDDASQAYLVVVRGRSVGKTYPVTGPEMVIGRAAGVDLQIDDEGVSRFHCKLRQDGNQVFVEDLGSRNGTYCNGERVVPGMRPLMEGDRLQIGASSVLRFTYVEGAAAAVPEGEDAANRDPLTGVFSRRYFMDRLDHEIVQSEKSPLALVLVHIDSYDEIAAAQGQEFANQVTIQVAGLVRQSTHKDDMLARLDSGDFALMSRRASPADVFMLAERLRKAALTLNPMTASGPVRVTLSLGVAAANELGVESVYELLIAAGNALYRATKGGGNRAVLCTQDLMHEPKNRSSQFIKPDR